MNGIQTIQAAFDETRSNLLWFLSDFSDADMFVRPHPAANHAACTFIGKRGFGGNDASLDSGAA